MKKAMRAERQGRDGRWYAIGSHTQHGEDRGCSVLVRICRGRLVRSDYETYEQAMQVAETWSTRRQAERAMLAHCNPA